jgi:Lar family restriction alleviation protein
MAELKPCPFCGSAAELRVIKRIPYGLDYIPRCTKTYCCGRLTKKFSEKETAIAMWNRRADNGT